jgi:hypothetical protein
LRALFVDLKISQLGVVARRDDLDCPNVAVGADLFFGEGFQIAVFVRSEINRLGIVGKPSSELARTVVRGEIDFLLLLRSMRYTSLLPRLFIRESNARRLSRLISSKLPIPGFCATSSIFPSGAASR